MKYPKYNVGDIVKGADGINVFHFLIIHSEKYYKVTELLSGRIYEFNHGYLDDSQATWLAA